MKSPDKNSTSTPAPSPRMKPNSSSTSEMLTPSEIESLRREMSRAGAYLLKRVKARKAARERTNRTSQGG